MSQNAKAHFIWPGINDRRSNEGTVSQQQPLRKSSAEDCASAEWWVCGQSWIQTLWECGYLYSFVLHVGKRSGLWVAGLWPLCELQKEKTVLTSILKGWLMLDWRGIQILVPVSFVRKRGLCSLRVGNLNWIDLSCSSEVNELEAWTHSPCPRADGH